MKKLGGQIDFGIRYGLVQPVGICCGIRVRDEGKPDPRRPFSSRNPDAKFWKSKKGKP